MSSPTDRPGPESLGRRGRGCRGGGVLVEVLGAPAWALRTLPPGVRSGLSVTPVRDRNLTFSGVVGSREPVGLPSAAGGADPVGPARESEALGAGTVTIEPPVTYGPTGTMTVRHHLQGRGPGEDVFGSEQGTRQPGDPVRWGGSEASCLVRDSCRESASASGRGGDRGPRAGESRPRGTRRVVGVGGWSPLLGRRLPWLCVEVGDVLHRRSRSSIRRLVEGAEASRLPRPCRSGCRSSGMDGRGNWDNCLRKRHGKHKLQFPF